MSDSDQVGAATFDTLVRALRRRLPVVLAAVIFAAGGALVLSLLVDEKYSASASILPRAANAGQGSLFGAPEADPEREAATNFELAKRGGIQRRAAARLERRGQVAAAEAVTGVDVSTKGESDLIEVEATAPEPRVAARAANAFADEFVAFRRQSERARIRQSQRLLKGELVRLQAARRRAGNALQGGGTGQEGAGSARSSRTIRSLTRRIRSLNRRSDDLTVLASLQTGNAAVVERATPPDSPSSPKPVRNTVIAGLGGLMLGLGLALVWERQDRRLRDSHALEEAFGLPLLASLPESDALGKGSTMLGVLPPFEAEGFRMLRANLRYLQPERDIDSVLITSAAGEDGKSTVAFHLAAAAAATGLEVLLIEADVRRPILARLLGLPPDIGLTTVLEDDQIRLADVCQEVLLPRSTNGRSAPPTMDVVLAGRVSPHATELIASGRMQESIREARERYALVVIDTPPAGMASDAIALMSQVSAVVVVGRIGRLTSDQAVHLRQQLEKINAPTVGVVANFTERRDRTYYSGGHG